MTDPAELAALFETDRRLHLYGLGDLQEPFWSPSRWYREGDAVVGAVRLPEGMTVGYAMAREDPEPSMVLFREVQAEIPEGSLVVGATGVGPALRGVRAVTELGVHVRMIRTRDISVETGPTVRLTIDHVADLARLREKHADEAFFLRHMIELGVYHGIYEGEELVAVAGTHVVDDQHGVAALGSVLTRADRRGRGLSQRVTAAVVSELTERVDLIGLNVKADNVAAITVYEKLGFEIDFAYDELVLGPLG